MIYLIISYYKFGGNCEESFLEKQKEGKEGFYVNKSFFEFSVGNELNFIVPLLF